MCTAAACINVNITRLWCENFSFPFLKHGVRKNTAWYDSEEARKIKLKQQNEETKDMYTSERKDAIYSQVAELHQQKSSISQSEQYSESKSEETTAQQEATSSDTTIKTSQQTSSSQHQQVQQIEQMTEWQKMATKEKKHVQYAQASHFSKVIVIFSIWSSDILLFRLI